MLTPPPLTPWEFVGYAWSNGEAGTVDTREMPRTRSFRSSVTWIEHQLAWADADSQDEAIGPHPAYPWRNECLLSLEPATA